jgi:hypothetical protein
VTARRFRPAEPVEVTAQRRSGDPLALRWRGRAERVAWLDAPWEVVAEWWLDGPEATRRRYYRLLTRRGLLCVVYRDLGSGRWFLEEVLD